MEEHKVKIKIGNSEFEAQGPKELVEKQFQAFMKAVEKRPQALEPLAADQRVDPAGEKSLGDATGKEEQQLLERLFLTDPKKRSLSIKFLPEGKTKIQDSLMLLLYGYQNILNHDSVTAVKLSESLKKSGIILSRLDRPIGPYISKGYILRGGRARATRYSLTNTGNNYAHNIISELLKGRY